MVSIETDNEVELLMLAAHNISKLVYLVVFFLEHSVKSVFRTPRIRLSGRIKWNDVSIKRKEQTRSILFYSIRIPTLSAFFSD